MLKKYILPLKKYILLEFAFDAISNTTLAFMPYLIKVLFDSFNNKTSFSFDRLLFLSFLYLMCVLISLVATRIHTIFLWKRSIAFEIALKRDFFSRIMQYSYYRFKSREIGEYLSIQANELTQLETEYLSRIIGIVKMFFTLIIYGLVLLYFIDFRIGIIIILVSILSAIFTPYIGTKTISKRLKVFLGMRGTYTNKVNDILSGFKLIKKDTYDNILNEHEKILTATSRERYAYGMAKSFFDVIRGFFLYLLNIISYAVIGWFTLFKNITIGTGVATLGYIESFTFPIQSIIADMTAIRSIKGIKEKVMSMLKKDTSDHSDKIISTFAFNHAIKFEKYSVIYDNFILSDFEYTFEKGKKYAIIGDNGSGKSTIINSLMKYIDPSLTKGTIYIDNHNLKIVDSSIIWDINQSEHIYNDSFIRNVTLFECFDFNYENIKNRLGKTVSEKLSQIKEKEDARLLSGGEKQLLSFIRMILADKDIWLLDEPFSAMDDTLAEALKSFITNTKSKTIIYITHDVSKYLNCFDEVIVLKKGQLACKGKWCDIQNIYKPSKGVGKDKS